MVDIDKKILKYITINLFNYNNHKMTTILEHSFSLGFDNYTILITKDEYYNCVLTCNNRRSTTEWINKQGYNCISNIPYITDSILQMITLIGHDSKYSLIGKRDELDGPRNLHNKLKNILTETLKNDLPIINSYYTKETTKLLVLEDELKITYDKLKISIDELEETTNILAKTENILEDIKDELNITDDKLNTYTYDLEETIIKLKDTINILVESAIKLKETEIKLEDSSSDLEETEIKLEDTINILAEKEIKLEDTEIKLKDTENKLTVTTDKLKKLENKIEEINNKFMLNIISIIIGFIIYKFMNYYINYVFE
jgi:DNA repair ATPase RecN